MKKLSDYSGKEAIELWADLFDPLSAILEDKNIRAEMTDPKVKLMDVAKKVMKTHSEEIFTILSRIDDEEINGANVFNKTVILLAELKYGNKMSAFFNSAEQEISEEEPSGSATENTEDGSK